MKERINICLEPEQIEAVKKLASIESEGNVSAWLRKLVNQAIKKAGKK